MLSLHLILPVQAASQAVDRVYDSHEACSSLMPHVWWPVGRWAIAALFATFLGVNGFNKKSLSRNGAIAGFAVGFASLSLSLRLGLILILFYKSSSILTNIGFDKKAKLTSDYKEGGQRGATQVLSCSLFATILGVAHLCVTGVGDSLVDVRGQPLGAGLLCAYLGFYACCAGDTWSSELGVLSKRPPRLITRLWTTVPAGTNGGVSSEGTMASAAAGLFMGTSFIFLGWLFRLEAPPSMSPADVGSQLPLILVGTTSGLLGSILDSLMGAVLQASYYDRNRKVVVEAPSAAALTTGDLELLNGRDILSNEQINVVSAVMTSILAGLLGPRVM